MGTCERAATRGGVRVLLVDDQKLFVESLRVYMSVRATDLQVVGVAYDGGEAVSMAETLKPDLVVMDVRMPGMDGVEASRILSERMPEVRVLMLTTFDDDAYVFAALNNGAVGYLLKDLDPSELVEAMRASISGSVQVAPTIATRLVSGSVDGRRTAMESRIKEPHHGEVSGDETAYTAEQAWLLLSRREREIVKLIAQGMDNREISAGLHIAPQTVKNRVSDIYTKLDVHNRLRLIRLCRDFGW